MLPEHRSPKSPVPTIQLNKITIHQNLKREIPKESKQTAIKIQNKDSKATDQIETKKDFTH